MKPFLLEWLEMLIDNSPQHPILRRIRDRLKLGENERDRLLCWIFECDYGSLLNFLRTEYLKDYISFISDVPIGEISQVRISGDVYKSDDLEGAFWSIRELISHTFAQEYPRPRSIRRKARKLSETISKDLITAVHKSDPISREQEIRRILGQARTDTEELIKDIDCFMSRLRLSDEQYKASRENLSAIISRIIKISPNSVGSGEIDGDAPRELARLIDCLSEKLEESQVNELEDAHSDFEDQKFIDNPYYLHALRIFGNIFHHEAANHSHKNLIQKYVDVAADYLRRLSELLPEVVYIESVEHRFSGQKVLSIYDPETQRTHRFSYTEEQLIERCRYLADKAFSGDGSFRKRLVEAFILPGNQSEQQVTFPYIVVREIIPLGKSYLHQLVEKTHERIEITVKEISYPVISSSENVQD